MRLIIYRRQITCYNMNSYQDTTVERERSGDGEVPGETEREVVDESSASSS